MLVRSPSEDELVHLQEIERAAGQRYRDYGLGHVADDEPAPLEVLAGYARRGRAWVAISGTALAVGYVLVDVIDGCAHIEQVSVTPAHQGQGAGRALIDRVRNWAVANGLTALTLTTFEHIPWNRPLYEHLGFRVLPEDQISPGLQAVRQAEAERGLDPALRVALRLDL